MKLGDWYVEVSAIFSRWTKRTLRQPMFLFFAILQPVLFFLLFTQAFGAIGRTPGFQTGAGTQDFTTYYSAAVVMQTVLSSSMQAGIGFVQDIESGFMDKMKVAPIRRSSILLGKIFSNGLRIILQVLIILGICALVGVHFVTGLAGIPIIVLLALAFGLAWSGISTFVALATKSTEATFMISMITTFPLLFLSTAVMPKQMLPAWVQTFAAYNPISYIGDAYHSVVITGFDWGAIGLAFGVCIAAGAITLSATTFMFKRAVSA